MGCEKWPDSVVLYVYTHGDTIFSSVHIVHHLIIFSIARFWLQRWITCHSLFGTFQTWGYLNNLAIWDSEHGEKELKPDIRDDRSVRHGD